jgi:hypothetical protein
VLEAARKLSPDDRYFFTAARLSADLKLKDTINPNTGKIASKATQIASAWLGKFVRWGYVLRAGQVSVGRGRAATKYALTDKGRSCEQIDGKLTKLANLVKAVRAFEKARGTQVEIGAYVVLLETCNRVAGG